MDDVFFAGVEGGATHSTLIVLNSAGKTVATVNGDGTNHNLVGIPEVSKRIAKMASEAKIMASIPEVTKFKAIGLSLSGCEQQSTNLKLEQQLKDSFPNLSETYVVCSDTVGSIFTVSALGGLVLISGTGSNALLRNPDGTTKNCGGWGHIMGDEGSAYWISQRAIKMVFDHEDNLEKCPHDISLAWTLIQKHFSIKSRADIVEHCYGKFQKAFFSGLCLRLSEGAAAGDPLCIQLFKDAGKQLAKMVYALLPSVSDELIKSGFLNIVCVGSVWLSWELLKNGFTTELSQFSIPYELKLMKLTQSMGNGAAYLAADSVKFELPRDYSKNYELFYNYTACRNGKSNGSNGIH